MLPHSQALREMIEKLTQHTAVSRQAASSAMRRTFSVVASIISIALPLWVGYALRPTPDQNSHALMWLIFTAASLSVSVLLSGFAIYYGQAWFRAIPEPRPMHRKIELCVLIAPPVLFAAVVIGRILSLDT